MSGLNYNNFARQIPFFKIAIEECQTVDGLVKLSGS